MEYGYFAGIGSHRWQYWSMAGNEGLLLILGTRKEIEVLNG